ncbi:hypothetical protein FQN51_008096 [Onygenales sp. PD_10]|nr:hypothetical protein FQN51_008096 [Onygenales sp. PD_10]
MARPPSTTTTTTPTPNPPWTTHLTLDLLLRVLSKTLFHPFIAWLIPLCLRAQATPYAHPSFIITASYATLVSVLVLLGVLNRWVAYGGARGLGRLDCDGDGDDDDDGDGKEGEGEGEGEEVVVVAGGGSGLGLLIAESYGMRGVSVGVLDVRDVGDVEGWEEGHRGVSYYRCDVGERGEVERVGERVVRELGTPTILINCIAAPINGLPLLSLTPAAIAKTIHANLFSFFHTLQVFMPGMLNAPHGGTIVTVSSVLSYLTAAGLSDYTATKAAIAAVHKTVEAELRVSGDDKKVKMLLVETGQMATPLFDGVETPNNFFAPVLEPVEVAREIIRAIDSGNGGVIRLPAFAKLASWYAVLPVGVQRVARYLSGIDMAVGRAGFKGPAIERKGDANGKARLKSQKSSESDR